MQVIARALVGNYNYNLNHELDIRKFKVFVLPDTKKVIYEKKKLGESYPYEVEDIRIWINRLIAGDIEYIETLFSSYVEASYNDVFHQIYLKRDEISLMNLKGVYDTCIGFYDDNINQITEDKEDMGYDRLLSFEIYRRLDFLLRYAQGFDFEKSLKYSKEERQSLFKLLMLNKLEMKDLQDILQAKRYLLDGFLPIYSTHNVNEKIKEFLISICDVQLVGIPN